MYIDLSSNQGKEVGLHVITSRRCPANLVPWNEHVHTHVEAKLGVTRRF